MPDTVTASEAYALRFSGDAGAYLLDVQELSLAAILNAEPRLPAGASFLDHAGTHGQVAPLLQQYGFARTVSASSMNLVDRANTADPKIVGPLHKLDMASKVFDGVICVRLLAHTDDIDAAVAEMCRLARQTVIVDYPSQRSINLFSRWLFKYKKHIERDTREFTSVSDRRLIKAFERNGFRLNVIERQFFIPMAIHRAVGSNRLMKGIEALARGLGLTRLMGNPAVARFDRIDSE
ncbi:methyltransferase domain-containing protein [Altererythrobacter lutimaris]|uniref:Methyltransferase domain-containing protein n=1 Tax=Altererythrobacter lutimaris TaxID=2743979 RepID=A0A850H8X7_9SPHN|nr:methyltransferase domain-containing protein [Altererythrobacter lutimaris]NVE93356.1 methyltransferase domain-containing protein [Altererythrobacter lutimaris]